MATEKLLNLIFIIIGLMGSLYVLYSIIVRNIKKEIYKSIEDILTKNNQKINITNATHR